MNPRFLAVCLWLLAWLAVSAAAGAGWALFRGRDPALAAVVAVGALFTAAVLASAGTDLW